MTTEHDIQNRIRHRHGRRSDVKLFRHNVGVGWTGEVIKRAAGPVHVTLAPGDIVLRNPRPLHAGLIKGAADLIGFQRVKISPDMVGQELGVFVSIEVKKPGGRVSLEQVAWSAIMTQFNCRHGVAWSEEDSDKTVGKP